MEGARIRGYCGRLARAAVGDRSVSSLALAVGWGEFLVGACVAIVLLLLATPTLIGRENYEVDFALEHDAVVAGQDAFGDFVVRSPRPGSRCLVASKSRGRCLD